MNYAEYLRQNGATDEEIKILDVASARKAYDAMVTRVEAAAAEAAATKAAMDKFKTDTDAWYNDTILPNYTKMEQDAAAAKANEARAVALIRASQDEGLRKVAESMGYKADGAGAGAGAGAGSGAGSGTPPNFDPTKYITRDDLSGLSDRVGEGLAALQDMVLEHSQLFPDQPLNVREIRKAAVAAKKDTYSYWSEKYKVDEARAARSKASQEAHDKKLREEGAAAARQEMADKYGQPGLAPPASSVNPFAARPGRESKQPWEEGDRSNVRVQHATKAVMDQISGQRPS